jgi:hypothetical protein
MSVTIYWDGANAATSEIGIFKTVFPAGTQTFLLDAAAAPYSLEDLVITSSKIIYNTDSGTGTNYIRQCNLDGSGDALIATIASSDIRDMVLMPDGLHILVCDNANGLILKVTIADGTTTTCSSAVAHPIGLCFDSSGRLFTFSSGGSLTTPTTLRQLDPVTGALLASSATFNTLVGDGLCFEAGSGLLWAVMNGAGNTGIQAFDPATTAASGSRILNASGTQMDSLTAPGDGNLYIADFTNPTIGIWKYSIAGGSFTGVGTDAFTVDGLASFAPIALSISCNNPGAATIGEPYSANPTASGGTAPYTYSITSGTLPPGLVLNASTGAIIGLPRNSGTYAFTITVTDANSTTASVACSIGAGLPGTVSAPLNSSFLLKKLTVAMKPDKHLPVRGAAQ